MPLLVCIPSLSYIMPFTFTCFYPFLSSLCLKGTQFIQAFLFCFTLFCKREHVFFCGIYLSTDLSQQMLSTLLLLISVKLSTPISFFVATLCFFFHGVLAFCSLQSQRMVGVGVTPGDGRLTYNKLDKITSRQVFWQKEPPQPLDSLFHCSLTLEIRKFVLVFRWNLMCISFLP